MPRKARTELAKKDIDFSTPVLPNIMIFGSEDDPCFGKLYSPKANECGRCGDSELCQIKMMHLQNNIREKAHKKGNYKDLEEVEIEIENYIISSIGVDKIRTKTGLGLILKKFKYPEVKGKEILIKIVKGSKKLKFKKIDGLSYICKKK